MSVSSFIGKGGEPCTGSWRVVRPQDGRRPFIGCLGWRPEDLPSNAGGHFACKMKDGVDAELLETHCEEEAPSDEQAPSEPCAFIAPKNHKGTTCTRYGGDEPVLVRAGSGSCPVRGRLLYPAVVTDKSSIRVIHLLNGVHNHIYPVCTPPVSAIESAVNDRGVIGRCRPTMLKRPASPFTVVNCRF